MSSQPLVSVILASYNAQDFLKESVQSILNQSYPFFEFIIVNDGSTDRTKEILECYAKKDARIILIHQENQGLTKALNVALRQAQGKYLARIDADDVSFPQRLEKQVHFLENHPDIFLLGSDFMEIDAQGKVQGRSSVDFFHSSSDLASVISCFNPFCHPSMIFRHDLSKIKYFYDETFIYAQDYELWVRMMKYYKAANLPQVLVYKRQLPNMISRAKLASQRYFALRAKLRSLSLIEKKALFLKNFIKDCLVSFLPEKFLKILKK